MKILHLTDCYEPICGGQEVYIQQLIKVCREQGFQSRVIQPYWASAQNSENILFFTPRIPKAHLIPGFHTLFMNLMTRILYKKQLEWADTIICHYASKAIFLKKYWSKVIILSHGVEWNVPAKTFWDKILAKNAAAMLKHNVRHVVNDTNYLRTLGTKATPGKNPFQSVKKNIWFVPNCVDTNLFRPQRKKKKKNQILVPRNFRYDRGIDLALLAFIFLKKKLQKTKIIFAGKSYPGPYLETIKKIIEDHKLEKEVVLFGHADQAALRKLYSSSMVCLIPTRAKEGTSLSALESMAMGTPCVSTCVGGLADLPTVKCKIDPRNMSTVLRKVMQNRKKIGDRQNRIVKTVFNLTNWKAAWLQIIRHETA